MIVCYRWLAGEGSVQHVVLSAVVIFLIQVFTVCQFRVLSTREVDLHHTSQNKVDEIHASVSEWSQFFFYSATTPEPVACQRF